MEHIELLIFDMDGTLYKTECVSVDASLRGIKRVYEENGINLPLPTPAHIMSHIGKRTEDYYKSLLPESVRHLFGKAHKYTQDNEVEALNAGKGVVYDGVMETLSELKRRGYKLAVASNSDPRYFNAVLDSTGIGKFLDRRMCIGMLNAPAKNKAPMLKKIVAELSVKNAVMVGDRIDDVVGAKDAGMDCIGCFYGYGSPLEFEHAIFSVMSLNELLVVFPEKQVKGL